MIQQILQQGGTEFITRLKQQQQQRGIRASGRSAASLRLETSDKNGVAKAEVYGADYFLQQEYGRGPTRKKGRGVLRDRILDWMDDKGIATQLKDYERRGIAYVIARKIHESGTRLYRGQGHPVGIQQLGESVAQKLRPKILQDANNRLRFRILGKFQDGKI